MAQKQLEDYTWSGRVLRYPLHLSSRSRKLLGRSPEQHYLLFSVLVPTSRSCKVLKSGVISGVSHETFVDTFLFYKRYRELLRDYSLFPLKFLSVTSGFGWVVEVSEE